VLGNIQQLLLIQTNYMYGALEYLGNT